MAESSSWSCVACGEPGVGRARYRCPACRQPYCGLQCAKTHKATCAGRPARDDDASDAHHPSSSARVDAAPPAAVAATARRGDGVIDVLEERHLVALMQDKLILAALRASELQQTIRIIDSSRSRLDALDAAMHNIPEFQQFCVRLLQTVYAADRPSI